MFGNGIGTLRVILRSADQERQLWALSAEAGNTWHQGQLTVSSATPFQVQCILQKKSERPSRQLVDTSTKKID